MSDDAVPHYKFYHYYPSLAGACVFTVIFAMITFWHGFLIFRHRTWYFIPLLIGGIFEIVGYACRIWSNKQSPNPTIGPYVIQTLLILVAPALFAATIYMTLGRIIISVDAEHHSLIKKKWLTKVFVTSDVITFFVQLGGAALLASTNPSTSENGSHIVLAGLAIQVVIFGFFVAVAMIFQRRLQIFPTRQSQEVSIRWKKHLYILYVTCTFIMFRSIVRIVEFVEGFEGEILTHEVFLFVFDAIPMAAVMAIFAIWYPSSFTSQARKLTASRECLDSNVELGEAQTQNREQS